MNEQEIAWDDLRTVLAIARGGSLSAAARSLDVSHATVFRRLGAIERRLGARLFERGRTGYAPTPAGEELAATAGRVEAEVLAARRRIAGRDLQPAGTVRLTTTDTLLTGLLSPILAEFRKACPDIALEIVVPSRLVDLSRRDADVAVRPTRSPPEHLVGRRIGRIAQAVYASRAAVGDAPGPDAADGQWVGPDETMGYRMLLDWMSEQGLDGRCRYRVDTVVGLHAAIRDGIGVGVMPCYLGDADPRLVRVGEPIGELALDLWLLTHPDLRRTARIRALMDHLATAVHARAAALAGASAADASATGQAHDPGR